MKIVQCFPFSFRSSTMAFLFILVSLMACETDVDPEPDPTGVQGSWQLTGVNINPEFNGISDYLAIYRLTGDTCPSEILFVFNENHGITINAPSRCQNTRNNLMQVLGINNTTTWKVDGNMLVITTGSTSQTLGLTVDNSTMSLVQSEQDLGDNENHTVTYVFMRM